MAFAIYFLHALFVDGFRYLLSFNEAEWCAKPMISSYICQSVSVQLYLNTRIRVTFVLLTVAISTGKGVSHMLNQTFGVHIHFAK
jgi:hypothetical protein